jgi:hypothetical protein
MESGQGRADSIPRSESIPQIPRLCGDTAVKDAVGRYVPERRAGDALAGLPDRKGKDVILELKPAE